MSLSMLASAAAMTIVGVTEIDLTSPSILVSPTAREAIASGSITKLICLDVSRRSRKFDSACLTSSEWRQALELARAQKRTMGPNGVIPGLLPRAFSGAGDVSHRLGGGRGTHR